MARETGSGKTPERLVKLINDEVKSRSLNSISKATEVGISALHRYQRGIGEPTTATLEKLAKYFDVPVWWLRGEKLEKQFHSNTVFEITTEDANNISKEIDEILEIYNAVPEHLRKRVAIIARGERDYMYDISSIASPEGREILSECCSRLGMIIESHLTDCDDKKKATD